MYFKSFITGSLKLIFKGSKIYLVWVSLLVLVMLFGCFSFYYQVKHGLIVTSMRDSVSWGFYIGNFTFLVGIAASAIILVIPAYVYNWKPLKEVVILGELLAICAILMCFLFVIVDLGRPELIWHMIPGIGKLQLNNSILAWDSVALSIYLILNLVITFYIISRTFKTKEINMKYILPLLFISIPAGIAIHTVTAFLYNGIIARPFWNSAILAPKFLASAFCSGPAIMLILFQVLRKTTKLKITNEVLWKVGELMVYAIFINLFFTVAEIFKEFYSNGEHSINTQYLYFGIGEDRTLVPYIWIALIFDFIAFILFLVPKTRQNLITLNIGAILIFIGVYVEKGIGLITPGFTPDTLGEIYIYTISKTELFVSLGVFSFGFLLYTLMLKVAVPVITGEFNFKGSPKIDK